jgi:predicted dehydrogenase
MEPLRFAVVGLGGYGLVHIKAVNWLAGLGLAKLVGVVALESDRKQRPDLVAELLAGNCTLYDSVEKFTQEASGTADVLTVPIGINMHVPVSVAAMRAGLHVYCEKPAAATVQEVDRLVAAKQETGRCIAIGFQHICSNSIQQLKARICGGRLGRVRSLSLMCGWPRSETYYSRNEWTGKLRVGEEWILDSPANNAHAHYLMNALYLCSTEKGKADNPAELRAELFRANRIEGPDTVVLRFTTTGGSSAFVILTHANGREHGPSMRLECEKGTAYWQTDNGKTFIRYADGRTEEFDNLVHDNWRFEGFRDFVLAVREGRDPLCTPELARAQSLTVNAMHESCPEIGVVPDACVSVVEDWEMFPPGTRGMFHRARGMDEYMSVAVQERLFFSELGIHWARGLASHSFSIGNYTRFPSRALAHI